MESKKKQISEDEDEYWNQSSIYGFGFDDDLKKAKQASALLGDAIYDDEIESTISGDSDNLEVVNWDGSVVPNDKGAVSGHGLSVSYKKGSPSIGGSRSSQKDLASIINPPGTNHKSSSPGSIGSQWSPVPSGKSSDGVYQPSSSLSQSEISKLEEENRHLRARLKYLRYRCPDIEETISRIIRREPHSFEFFKSKAEKVKLLDAAIESCDGNAITAVVLFLKSTLTYSLFQEQLISKPIAANHYVAYLRDHFRFDELISTLFFLDRKEEAAMVEFQQACQLADPGQKIGGLKMCLGSRLRDPALTAEAGLVKQYVTLLEQQIPVEETDQKAIREGRNQSFKQFPKSVSVINQPILTTLYYCCLYHYDLPNTSYASPLHVKTSHHLSDKQFIWIAVKALSRQQNWPEIQKLLTSKTIFGLGIAKLKSPIAYDRLVQVLQKQKAPVDILSIYIKEIQDNDKKLDLAIKNGCHKLVVDMYVSNQDRQSLVQYASKLAPRSKDAYYAQGALQNQAYKWRN